MKRNIFLTFTGFETLIIGIFLAIKRHYFLDDPHDRFIHVSYHMGDLDWAVILIAIGILVIAVGWTNFNKWHAQSIMIIILSGLWCAYFVAFLLQDLHFPGGIQMHTIMTGCFFLQILVEARFGGDNH